MNERFEPYLDEVSVRLKRVEDSRRSEIIAELRSHLVLSQRSGREELGLSDEESARAALRSLGAAKNVAEDLLKQETGISGRSAWRLARWSILLDLLIVTVLPLLLELWPETYRSATGLQMGLLASPLVLIFFGVAVWRSRRWLVWPMVLAILVFGVGECFVLASPAYQRAAQAAVNSLGGDPHSWEKQLESDLQLARGGEAELRRHPERFAFAGEYRAPDFSIEDPSYAVPYLPFLIPGPRNYVMDLGIVVPTVDEAADLWRRNGAALIRRRESQLAYVRRPQDDPSRLTEFLLRMAAFAAARISQLALLNGLLLAVLAGRRRLRIRRDAHLA